MGLSDWLRNQATALVLATASVEKNALGQKGESLNSSTGMHQRLNQGRLSDDLLRGELTQQVKEIRWRTYKVLQEVEQYVSKSVPVYVTGKEPEPVYDNEGNITHYTEGVIDGYTTISVKVDNLFQKELDGLTLDPIDDYLPELCVINDVITETILDSLDNNLMASNKKPEIYIDKDNEGEDETRATHGIISHELKTTSKYNRPLLVEREFRPRIELERFTKRMVVRNISEDEKLLEFYVSKYSDEHDKRTSLIIAECKKILTKGLRSDMTDLRKVGFITMDDVGVPDYLEYQYEVIKFDKIVDFDGNYVLKFKAKPIVNGKDLLEEFVDKDLEEKYNNKEVK